MEVRLTGGAQLHDVRRKLKDIGDKGLGKQMGKALREVTQPLRKEIRAEVPRAMPSGYAPTLSKSLQFRQSVRETRHTARVEFRVYAKGQREKRDVPALNRGRLRKPLFGNRSRWYDQKVRVGFVDRPVDRLGPDIKRQMNAVIDTIADQIKG